MHMRRHKDTNGKTLKGSNTNPIEWQIVSVRHDPGKVVVIYKSRKKPSAQARYILELTTEELGCLR